MTLITLRSERVNAVDSSKSFCFSKQNCGSTQCRNELNTSHACQTADNCLTALRILFAQRAGFCQLDQGKQRANNSVEFKTRDFVTNVLPFDSKMVRLSVAVFVAVLCYVRVASLYNGKREFPARDFVRRRMQPSLDDYAPRPYGAVRKPYRDYVPRRVQTHEDDAGESVVSPVTVSLHTIPPLCGQV